MRSEFLFDGRRLEDLDENGLKIVQDTNLYTFTSDSIVLANFLVARRGETCVEFGTGCGVISILTAAKSKAKHIYAFEMQQPLAKLAQENVALNHMQERITVIEAKAQDVCSYLQSGSADMVFSNPPYMPQNEIKSCDDVRSKARHDKFLPPEELCIAASKVLRFGGRFYLVYAASRMAEIFYHLVKSQLEPKRILFTRGGKGRTVLVVIEAVKGGKHGLQIVSHDLAQ